MNNLSDRRDVRSPEKSKLCLEDTATVVLEVLREAVLDGPEDERGLPKSWIIARNR